MSGTGAESTIPLNLNPESQGIHNLPADIMEGFKDVTKIFAKSTSEHSDKLLTAIYQQSTTLSSAFEKLITAVEELKQHPPVTDNKTTFWTAYKTLADEYDKETQRKYGNDLDTALIFAGLFSAVSSAFIIQIQPELQPTSELTGTTLALLTLLAQNISVPTSTTSSSSAPPTIIVVAQGFLYFSLFSTLLAALLAVLGKQWILHYDSVGERGTIAERGLERQHKFDGMQRWKFDLAMQMFPLLLQFALLLFAIALSTYLWTINHAIAGLVLGLTALGCILYTAMVVSAMKSADSPFQTPLTRLLNIVVAKFILPGWAHHIWDHIPLHRLTPSVPSPPLSPHNLPPPLTINSGPSTSFFPSLHRFLGRNNFVKKNWHRVEKLLANLQHFLVQIWTVFITSGSSPAPGVSLQSSTPIFNNIPPPSPECSAVVWVLETSTNPLVVQSVAALVPDLQWWPLSLNIGPSKQRLVDALESCRSGDIIPANMETRASLCAKAVILLNLVDDRQNYQDISSHQDMSSHFQTGNKELKSLLQTFNSSSLHWNDFTPTHWTLRALNGKKFTTDQLFDFIRHVMDERVEDQSTFAEVLFCLNAFFLPALPCDHSVVDKSPHIIQLTTQLFRNLVRYFAETKKPRHNDLSMMVRKIAKLARGKGYYPLVDSLEVNTRKYSQTTIDLMNAAYKFCVVPNLPSTAITYTLELLPFLDIQNLSTVSDDYSWLYSHFKDIPPANELYIGYSLRVLDRALSTDQAPKPSVGFLKALLHVLTDVKRSNGVKSLTSNIICRQYPWFLDNELGPLLEKHSVWANLAQFSDVQCYLSLGQRLSQTPKWKELIWRDLPAWLLQLRRLWQKRWPPDVENYFQMFQDTLQRVWNANADEAEHFRDEKTLAMVFMALANVWDHIAISSLSSNRALVLLLERTTSAVFSAHSIDQRILHPSRRLKETIMVRLAAALMRAGEQVRHKAENNRGLAKNVKNQINEVGQLIKKVGTLLNQELQTSKDTVIVMEEDTVGYKSVEKGHWEVIKNSLMAELEPLQNKVLEELHVMSEDETGRNSS